MAKNNDAFNKLVSIANSRESGDKAEYFEKYLKIKDRDSANMIPFKVNSSQLRLKAIIDKWDKGDDKRTLFIIILKARRQGFSTYVEADFFTRIKHEKNKTAMIISYDDPSSTEINKMTDKFYQYLPQEHKPLRRPSRSNGLKLENPKFDFLLPISPTNDPGLQSEFLIETAGNPNAASGYNINYLHVCMHKDSLIIMEDGSSKSIKEVCIGDLIITSAGEISPITNKFYMGKKNTYTIETWLSNENISVTAEHKILTDSGYKKCEDLSNQDWIRLPSMQLTNKIRSYTFRLMNVPRKQGGGKQHVEKISFRLDYDAGYFIGYYLAEGHVHKHSNKYPNYYDIVFASHISEKYFENIIPFVERFASSYKIKEEPSANRRILVVRGRILAEAVNDICGRTVDKQIPSWFFKTNKKFIKGVLAGYFSGDGTKTKAIVNGKYPIHSISAISICEKITRQIKRLILSLDKGVPSVRFYTDRTRYGKKTKDVYNIACNGKLGKFVENLIGNSNDSPLKSSSNKYKKINGSYYVKIRSIEPFEIADVYDIEVESKNHDFETPIGIVSNSELAKWSGDIKSTMTSMLPSIPLLNSIVIVESTAKGYNFFKDLWDDSNTYDNINGQRVKKNDYIPLFIPWFFDQKCVLPYTGFSLTRFKHPLFGNEFEIFKTHKVSYEQLEWRRWCIRKLGTLEEFHQEFPCVAKGQLVSTNKGFKKIEDIECCDVTETGIVKGKFNKGIKPILKITTFSKRIIRVTHEHLMATSDGFVKANKLAEGDVLSLSKPIFAKKYYSVEYNEYPVKKSTILINEKIGLFLGYFTGDGSFLRSLKKQCTVDFACDARDINVCEEIESLCEYIIGSKPTNRLTGKNKGCYNIRSNNNKWFDFMLNLDCIHRKNDDRYIRKVSVPKYIMNSPKSVIKEFISGLFEADGCIYKYSNNIMLFSKHEDFLRDIQLLLLGFGIGSNIRTQDKINGSGRKYIGRVLYISAEYAYIFKNEIGFKSDRKISYCSKSPRKTTRKTHSAEFDRIISIEEDGNDMVYDLTLSNDNPTFGVNGILVHNCSPEEAFIATGSAVFDNAKVQARLDKLREYYKDEFDEEGNLIIKFTTGEFSFGKFKVDRTIDNSKIEFIPADHGIITIYQEPKKGFPYMIGCDTAGEGSDYFAAHVINNKTGEQVAVYHCQHDSDLFAYQMYCLGIYYNEAMIAIEMNFDPSPINRLQDLFYWNLYKREVYDSTEATTTKKVGFQTNSRTRELVISTLIEVVRDNIQWINDIETLKEMLEFIKSKTGKKEANTGKHDDLVMSLSITYGCADQMVSDVEVVEELDEDELDEDDIDANAENWMAD